MSQVTIKMTVKGSPVELTGTLEEVMKLSKDLSSENEKWEKENQQKTKAKEKEQDFESLSSDIFNKLIEKGSEAAKKLSSKSKEIDAVSIIMKSKEVEAASAMIVSAVTKKVMEKAGEWMDKQKPAPEKKAEAPKAEKSEDPVNPS